MQIRIMKAYGRSHWQFSEKWPILAIFNTVVGERWAFLVSPTTVLKGSSPQPISPQVQLIKQGAIR